MFQNRETAIEYAKKKGHREIYSILGKQKKYLKLYYFGRYRFIFMLIFVFDLFICCYSNFFCKDFCYLFYFILDQIILLVINFRMCISHKHDSKIYYKIPNT